MSSLLCLWDARAAYAETVACDADEGSSEQSACQSFVLSGKEEMIVMEKQIGVRLAED